MATISVSCVDKVLTITDAPIVDIGGLNTIQFSFCPMWDGYEKTVKFHQSKTTYSASVVENMVTIPSELIENGSCFCFKVIGTKAESEDRESQIFSVRVESCQIIAEDPSEDIHEQISDRVKLVENWIDDIYRITESEIDNILEG